MCVISMILATDVHYREEHAVVSGILFEKWESDNPLQEISLKVNEINDYVPGQFYKRELPCIKALLDGMVNVDIHYTAEGIDTETAKQYIRNMHGEYRIPTLLKRVDALCRIPLNNEG